MCCEGVISDGIGDEVAARCTNGEARGCVDEEAAGDVTDALSQEDVDELAGVRGAGVRTAVGNAGARMAVSDAGGYTEVWNNEGRPAAEGMGVPAEAVATWYCESCKVE